MRNWLNKLFAPPDLTIREDKARIAGLLHAITLTIFIVTGTYSVGLAIFEPGLLPRLALVIPLFLLLGAIQVMFRRGYVQFASLILVGGIWVVLMYVTALNGGVGASAYSGTTVVVLIAGLLLGRRAAFITAAISILAGLGFLYANAQGLLVAASSFTTPPTIWAVQAIFFIIAALVLHLATQSIGEALAQARAELANRQRLEQTQEQRRILLENVVQLGKTVAQATNWDDCLVRIYDSVRTGLGFDRAGLLLYDPATQKMRSAIGTDRQGNLVNYWADGVTFEADPTVQNLLVNPAGFQFTANYSASLKLPPEHGMYGVTNHAILVAWVGQKPVGILAVDNLLTQRPITAEQLEALQLFAGYVGLAIENSRLLAESTEALDRERQFNQVTYAINNAPDISSLLSTVVHLSAQLVNAQGGWLGLLSEDQQNFTNVFFFNLPAALQQPAALSKRGLSWQVAQTHQSILIHNYKDHPQAVSNWISFGTEDCLSVPLMAGEACTGVLSLVTVGTAQHFTERDLALVEGVGRQAGVAAQNVMLLQKAQQRAAQLSILNEVGRAISTLRDLPDVLDRIYQQVQRGLSLDVFYVALYDAAIDEISFPLMFDDGVRYYRPTGPLSTTGLARRVISSGEPILLNRTPEELENPTPAIVPLGNLAKRSASMLLSPLRSNQSIIGVISAQSYTLNAYTEEHLSFLVGLGHQTAIAIENARLFEAERRQVTLLTALYEIGLDVNAQLDLQSLLQISTERAMHLFDATQGGLYLLEADSQTLELVATSAITRNYIGERIPLGQGLAGRVAQTGQPLIIDDYNQWEGRALVYDEETRFRSVLGVPIQWRGQLLGVIDVVDEKPNRFSPADVEPVRLLAAQAAVAIQNARLFNATQRQLEELRVLRAVAVAATEILSEDELVERSTAIIGNALFQDYCGILLVDQKLGVLIVHPSHRGMSESMKKTLIPLGQGITGQVAARGEPLRLADVRQDPAYLPANPSMVSELCVPLKAGDRVIGVINVESPQVNAFTENDEHLLVTVAGQLAPAIERLRAEAQVRQLNTSLERRVVERTAQLEAAVKELEAFSYSVSHDLRAPLRSIDGFSQALLEDYHDQLDDEGRRHLEIVRHEVQHMGQLIDDLLNLARVTRVSMHRTEVDLSELARTLVTTLYDKEPERQVEFDLAPQLKVFGDPNLLRIMLDNLLTNAWKFTGKRNRAQITLGRQKLPSGEIVFFVRDNGAGFDMAFANKLFGAFQRLHSQLEFEGTGIGLATVQRIVTRHGGRIWATSAVNEGATFYFSLPAETYP